MKWGDRSCQRPVLSSSVPGRKRQRGRNYSHLPVGRSGVVSVSAIDTFRQARRILLVGKGAWDRRGRGGPHRRPQLRDRHQHQRQRHFQRHTSGRRIPALAKQKWPNATSNQLPNCSRTARTDQTGGTSIRRSRPRSHGQHRSVPAPHENLIMDKGRTARSHRGEESQAHCRPLPTPRDIAGDTTYTYRGLGRAS